MPSQRENINPIYLKLYQLDDINQRTSLLLLLPSILLLLFSFSNFILPTFTSPRSNVACTKANKITFTVLYLRARNSFETAISYTHKSNYACVETWKLQRKRLRLKISIGPCFDYLWNSFSLWRCQDRKTFCFSCYIDWIKIISNLCSYICRYSYEDRLFCLKIDTEILW